MRSDRRHFVGAAAAALLSAGFGGDAFALNLTDPLPDDELASLRRANGWINSPPLTAASLRGRVVLVDIWTFTCINWRRTLPYVRAWHQRYKGDGLEVIGVHSPEFAFEHIIENVRRASVSMDVAYPIAIDNDFAIWKAFTNQGWPARYLIDAQGKIRYSEVGEGDYEGAERAIQAALTQAGARNIGSELTTVEGKGAEAPADWPNVKSPENYLGYERTENFESSNGTAADERRAYSAPAQLRANHWALAGDWTVQSQSVRVNKASGRIQYGFHARDLHVVMGPSNPRTTVRFRVTLNGAPPGAAHGGDIDADGNGVLNEQRLYQLIRQRGQIADQQFAIEFLDAGAEAFSFAFG